MSAAVASINASCDDNDDTSTLLRLTKTTNINYDDEQQGQREQQLVSTMKNSFRNLSNRFINEDMYSPVRSNAYDQFWNELTSSFDSFGFASYCYRKSDENCNNYETNVAESNDLPWINFESDAAKSHLDAVTSLLGMSNQYAKLITNHVLEEIMIKSSNDNNNRTKSDEERAKLQSTISSLLGTKKLLLIVRDHHYQQQISRIRFITEALRQEQDDDDDHQNYQLSGTSKQSCQEFLDDLDKRTLLVHNSSNNNGLDRGLIKFLLCIACAHVDSLQREHFRKSFALRSNEGESHIGNMDLDSSNLSQQSFTKDIMESHLQHYGSTLRTEALECIFMLLYTRIHGGITRSDYLLLLQAFDKQQFFSCQKDLQGRNTNNYLGRNSTFRSSYDSTNCNEKIMMKRRSQLVAFIMAECMTLWRATNRNRMNNQSEQENEWILTHPLFLKGIIASSKPSGDCESCIITSELKTIGKLLLEKHSKQVEIRRQQICSSGDLDDGHTLRKEAIDQVDAPESIAILTFGLLLRIANSSSSKTVSSLGSKSPIDWASADVIKDLSSQCITISNNECGAFEYLELILNNFLPDYKHSKEISVSNQYVGADDEWNENKYCQISAPRHNVMGDAFGEDGMTMSYASIGKEIVVGVISAFQGALSVSDTEDVFMMCRLATKTFRNNVGMCSQFWSDWELESKNNYMEDPMCFLLDALYQIAHIALNEDICNDDDMLGTTAFNNAKFAASILPKLQPFLSLITCLIPSDGKNILQILQAFLSNGVIHASVIGCLYVCNAEDINISNCQTSGHYRDLLESSASVMNCLSIMVELIPENDLESMSFLWEALVPLQSIHSDRAHVLYEIATSACLKMKLRMDLDYEVDLYSRITSSSLLTMVSFLQYQGNDDNCSLTNMLLKGFSRKTGKIRNFVKSKSVKVTSASMNFLHTVNVNAMKVIMSNDTKSETVSNLFRVIEDGVNSVIEVLSTLDLNGKMGFEQHSIAYKALLVLEKFLYTLNDIVIIHRDKDIQRLSMDIRNFIIINLAGSTSIGKVISFFAISPLTSLLIDSALTENKKLSIQGGQAEQKLMQLASSRAATSLLVAWMQISEQITINRISPNVFQESLDALSNSVSEGDQKNLVSTLTSVSPVQLLLSDKEPTKWCRDGYSILSSLCKYIKWVVEDEGSRFYQLAMKALKLISMTVNHARIVSSGGQSSVESFYSRMTVQQIGSQLHVALCLLLRKSGGIDGSKRYKMLLELLQILHSSIPLNPFLAKEILVEPSVGSSSLMFDLLATLQITHMSSIDDVDLAASSAGILSQLWKFCRERFDGNSSQFHPCTKITHDLTQAPTTFKEIVEILSNHEKYLSDFQNGKISKDVHSKVTICMHAKFVEFLTSLLETIRLELNMNSRVGKDVSESINELVEEISKLELLQKLFQSLIVSQSQNASIEDLSLSKVGYSENALNSVFGSKTTMDPTSNLLLFQAHLRMLQELLQLGETLHAYYFVGAKSPSNDDFLSEIELAMKSFTKLIDTMSVLSSSEDTTTHHCIYSQVPQIANTLMQYLLLFFSTFASSCGDHFGRVLVILEALLHVNEVIIGAGLQSSEMRVKTNMMVVFNISIYNLKQWNASSQDEEKTFRKIQLRCCKFVCDTIASLDLDEHFRIITSETLKGGAFIDVDEMRFLLRTTIISISLLIPDNYDNAESTLQRDSYLMDFTLIIRNCDAISHLISLLDKASSQLTKEVEFVENIENNFSYEVIIAILDLLSIMIQSDDLEMPVLLMEYHIINVLMENPLLLHLRDQYSGKHRKISNFRGYKLSNDFSLQQKLEMREEDPLHKVWRFSLRIIASLARSSSMLFSSTGSMSPGVHERNIVSVVDFIRTHQTTIETLIQDFETSSQQIIDSNQPRASKENEYAGFSVAILNETGDLLSLISALCTAANMKLFEANANQVIQRFTSFSTHVVQSLSSFLGSIGTAKELFSMLNSLNESNEDEMLRATHERLVSHPLFADGVSQGKHEAIRHVLFANNFCSCITKNDLILSQMVKSRNTSMSSEVEQFQALINNEFLCYMENIAAQCVFNALSIATKVRCAFSSFTPFTIVEAAELRLSTIPPNGTNVIIRQKNSFVENMTTESFARIIGVNEINQTFTVQYMDTGVGNSIEDHVTMSRLAAIQDVSTIFTLFKQKSAAESICNAVGGDLNEGATIGNLIHILRWCCNYNPTLMDRGCGCLNLVSEHTVKSIAEIASIILAQEISLHHEAHMTDSASIIEVQNINRQLFDLFSSDSDSNGCKLQQLLTKVVWESVQRPLVNALNSARADKENIRMQLQQNFGGGWSKTSTTLYTSRRRSPFK